MDNEQEALKCLARRHHVPMKVLRRGIADAVARYHGKAVLAFTPAAAAGSTEQSGELTGRPSRSSPPAPETELPTSPPAWWSPDLGESPIAFVERVYASWLDKGLTRAFFQRPGQDKVLYNALAECVRRNPAVRKNPPAWLRTKKQINKALVKEFKARGSTKGMSAQEYLRLRSADARQRHQILEPQSS